jgi:hypothetical protein
MHSNASIIASTMNNNNYLSPKTPNPPHHKDFATLSRMVSIVEDPSYISTINIDKYNFEILNGEGDENTYNMAAASSGVISPRNERTTLNNSVAPENNTHL